MFSLHPVLHPGRATSALLLLTIATQSFGLGLFAYACLLSLYHE